MGIKVAHFCLEVLNPQVLISVFTATVFICSLYIYIMMFVFKERRWKLKKGTVQDQDIRKISYSAAVKEKRKRICRALLGVENADSHLADIAQNQDIEEQTYQIFRKWKQFNDRTSVTYQALAQALLDRTVNLDQVVTDFCTAIQGGEEN